MWLEWFRQNSKLTLIQTIIECLKYVTTGLMPPGTMGGKSFVFDPKLVLRP